MYRIDERDNSKAPTLNHSPEVFHEALKGKEDRYHIINNNGPDYDLVYSVNDDLIPGKPDYLPFELIPNYRDFDYDENNRENLCLTLFDGLDQLVVEEINEYTVAIINAVLSFTDMDIITNDKNINLFFDINNRIALVEILPDFNKDKMFYICKDYGVSAYGNLESVYNRMDSLYAFHNLFFIQWLTGGKPLKDFKYIKTLLPDHANVGGILIDLLKFKAAFETIGLKFIDNDEYIGRFNRNVFDKYFDLGLYNPEAKEDETITINNLFSVVPLNICNIYDLNLTPEIFKPEIREEMDGYYNSIFNGDKVLGVLARGTDYKRLFTDDRQDRFMVVDDKLINKIKEWIDKHQFDSIFLATEDIDILNNFKDEFGDKVSAVIQERYSVNDFTQDENTFDQIEAKMNQDIELDEIMEDTILNYLFALYLLSKCDSFLSAGYCNGFDIALNLNEGKYKNVFRFGFGDVITEEDIGVAEPIKLSGRLDVTNRDKVIEKIKNEYVEGNPMILDFSDVDYISTAGLSNIIMLKEELNRDVTLTGLNEKVKERLKTANLNKVFNLK